MRLALAVASLLALPGAAAAGSEQPSAETIAAIERALELPPSAATIAAYARYYAFKDEVIGGAARRIVVGLLVSPKLRLAGPSRGPGAYPVDALPSNPVLDGGCSVIEIGYDPQVRRVIQVTCNGEG